MNTRFVEAFLLVARLGSFRAAADRLHITQAAVSNRIGSLEEELGCKLFERDPRDLRLTPVGLRLLDYGERMLELQREMVTLGNPEHKLLGRVRIGAIESVVHTWLVSFLKRLQSSYPGIEVEVSSETTAALHQRLQQGSIDIALQTDPVLGEGIVSTPCQPMAMGWVAAGDTVPRLGEGNTAALLQREVITMSPGSQPHQALRALYRDAGLPMGKVHCVSSIAAIVRLVRAGFGHAVLPLPPVRDEVDRGELRVIAPEVPLPSQRLMISHLAATNSEAIRLVADLAARESRRYAQALPAPFAVV